MDIKHRFTNQVLCSFEAKDIKDCLQQAIKNNAYLSGADLYGANLYGANLNGADLNGADLSSAILSVTILRGANLNGADLSSAILRGADLRGADLRGADLNGADLSSAILRGADLRGADLNGEKIAIAPILIGGLIWDICISESYLEIGCQRHLHSEWLKFSDEDISKMESRALDFWKQNKSWIMSACKAHRKESLTYRKQMENN